MWPVMDGLLGGAVPGLATLAVLYLAPWWLIGVAGFLTAPVLLATFVVRPPGMETMWIAIVGGSMLLYAGYVALILHWRNEQTRLALVLVIMLVHAACMIAWIGEFLGTVGEQLVLYH